MGSIIPFFGGPDASLPPERAKLVRNGGERAGIAAKISVLAGMRQKLEGEFSKVGEAERERDSLIHRAARSLVDRLSGGGEFGFETLSRKAAVEGEKIATSQVKAKIIETALSEIDGELRSRDPRWSRLFSMRPSANPCASSAPPRSKISAKF